MNNSKMYILILDDIPLGFAINSAAHASLIAHLKWNFGVPAYDNWLEHSFKKVTCKVNMSEFTKAVSSGLAWEIITESTLGEGKPVAVVFCPLPEGEDWPNCFKYFQLYK
tara:strand:- start:3477 stop:3806 length:330 start_codon:yes stop_codon:yes gene_type:complete